VGWFWGGWGVFLSGAPLGGCPQSSHPGVKGGSGDGKGLVKALGGWGFGDMG
jgi:hypothetical protein